MSPANPCSPTSSPWFRRRGLLTLITYRPEYRGALAQVPGAQTIALAPLTNPETVALVSELLGPDPSVARIGRDNRRKGFWHTVLRRGDRSRAGGTRCAARKAGRLRIDGCGSGGQCARHAAGHHRLAHRPTRPEGETNAERGSGCRLAIRRRPVDGPGHRTGGRRPAGGSVHRPGHVHRGTPNMCSTIR